MEENFYEWLLLLTFIGCFAAVISSGSRFHLVGLSIILFTNGFIYVTSGYDLVTKSDLISTLSKAFIELFILNVVYIAALCFISANDRDEKRKAPSHGPSRDPAIMYGNRLNLVDKIMGPHKY